MNTNPESITILCYGDSNTQGTKPDRTGRFKANERWPGVLQGNLGNDYYVIEEGLGGRTTDLEHYKPGKPSRNGLTYFKACVDSHMPLDIVIVTLGINDLKTVYNRSAEEVATALKQYPDYIRAFCSEKNMPVPKIILASPPIMNDKAPKFLESMPTEGIYDEGSVTKSHQLAEAIEKSAKETDCAFLDVASVTEPGEDGLHLTLRSHKALGDKFTELIKKLA